MISDRLQAAWPYMHAEIWRPLFTRFSAEHPDLPIEVVRSFLVRPGEMPQIFLAAGQNGNLDKLREDVATYLDLPGDARSALKKIKPEFFTGGRAVALALSDVAVALHEYDSAELSQAYRERVARFLERHALPYRLDFAPLKLTPLLHGEVDRLYRELAVRAAADANLQEALIAFENAWERQSTDWNQISAKDAIRTASLLAENMLVSASNGHVHEFTAALTRMRNNGRFPSNDFANIFDRAYTFANKYPNIRHPGDAACVKRDLRKQDAVLSALVFVGLSACAHDLCTDDPLA